MGVMTEIMNEEQYALQAAAFQLNFFKDKLSKLLEDADRNREHEATAALRKVKDEFDVLYKDFSDSEAVRKLTAHISDVNAPKNNANKSDFLAVLNQASARFWANADPEDSGTHPLNKDVAVWLVANGYKPTLADKGATIIRPSWAPTGRKADK